MADWDLLPPSRHQGDNSHFMYWTLISDQYLRSDDGNIHNGLEWDYKARLRKKAGLKRHTSDLPLKKVVYQCQKAEWSRIVDISSWEMGYVCSETTLGGGKSEAAQLLQAAAFDSTPKHGRGSATATTATAPLPCPGSSGRTQTAVERPCP